MLTNKEIRRRRVAFDQAADKYLKLCNERSRLCILGGTLSEKLLIDARIDTATRELREAKLLYLESIADAAIAD